MSLFVPQPGPGQQGITSGSTIDVRVSSKGSILLTVTKPDGTPITHWQPPMILKPPAGPGPWVLQVLTSSGYQIVRGYAVGSPGVYRWVRPPRL